MSKIARNPVPVPAGVTVELNGRTMKARGPKGELSLSLHDEVTVAVADNDNGSAKEIRIAPQGGSRQAKAMWGTTWSLVRNILKGVHEGFIRDLEIQGVGYRANLQGNTLVLQLGYSHDVHYPVPEGIKIAVEKQTSITISGIDKQRVGQVAAEIRSFRPPEPYKGKGVRYKDEYIQRKEGKKK